MDLLQQYSSDEEHDEHVESDVKNNEGNSSTESSTINSDNNINKAIELNKPKKNKNLSTLREFKRCIDILQLPSTSRDSGEMSDMVIKNNIINASIHGPINSVHKKTQIQKIHAMMKFMVDEDIIMNFDSKERQDNLIVDSESSEDETEESSSDSDSDLLSECECLKDAEEESDGADPESKKVAKKNTVIKSKGELGLEDLPPIQDLAISVPEQECEAVGTISEIVDQLVIVESVPNKPSLDLDTVLFLDNGKVTLGHIFDVFGQVTQPFYCVRFNSENHIKEKGVERGAQVYYAPKTDHTKFVVVSELMRAKGSDASWRDDTEIPNQFADFSDDEEERAAKRAIKNNKKNGNVASVATDGDAQKLSEYEQKMNKRNIMKTVESNRHGQSNSKRRFDSNSFNPFGHRNSAGNWSTMQPRTEIRWHPDGNVVRTRFPASAWYQNVQQSPPLTPMYNIPPFMRAPRFAVPPPNFNQQIYPRYTVPPPPIGTPPSAPWMMYHTSTAPPGT